MRAIVILLLFSISTTATASGASAPPRVEVDTGLLEGVVENNIAVYRGIPYAAAPVGELRWRAPQAADSWDGVHSAKEFGPICPQMRPSKKQQSESCLTLNIWAPLAGKKLPVMLWIHGGANVNGSGDIDGSSFARDGVVLVSLNYRLGRLGVFAHPELTTRAKAAGEAWRICRWYPC
jgi:para-nitrobenzyl esterase